MCDVLLSEADQAGAAVRAGRGAGRGAAAPPVRTCSSGWRRSSACDAIGAALTDPNGYVVDEVELPDGHTGR